MHETLQCPPLNPFCKAARSEAGNWVPLQLAPVCTRTLTPPRPPAPQYVCAGPSVALSGSGLGSSRNPCPCLHATVLLLTSCQEQIYRLNSLPFSEHPSLSIRLLPTLCWRFPLVCILQSLDDLGKLFAVFLFLMCTNADLRACLCGSHMPGTHRRQKKVPNPLEPKSQMVVSRHVGSGSQTWVLCQSGQRS